MNFKNYKIPLSSDDTKQVESWRQYAIDICKDLNIKPPYSFIIFRQAKLNLEYLRGKVENTKEKFGSEGYKTKGNYLISLFRSKKPWEL